MVRRAAAAAGFGSRAGSAIQRRAAPIGNRATTRAEIRARLGSASGGTTEVRRFPATMLSIGTVSAIEDATTIVGDTSALSPQLHARLRPATALIVLPIPSAAQGRLAVSARQDIVAAVRDEPALRSQGNARLGDAGRRSASVCTRAATKLPGNTIPAGEDPPTSVEGLPALRGKTQARGGDTISGLCSSVGRSSGAGRDLPLSTGTTPGTKKKQECR